MRPAATVEREALEALQWRASLTNPEDQAALLAHPDAIHLPVEEIEAGRVLVAEVDGTVAGFAAVQPHANGDLELDGLFVEPALFRRGVGRALIERCAALARDQGGEALHAIGNERAFAFYEACGFRFVEPRRTRFGPAVLLRRDL